MTTTDAKCTMANHTCENREAVAIGNDSGEISCAAHLAEWQAGEAEFHGWNVLPKTQKATMMAVASLSADAPFGPVRVGTTYQGHPAYKGVNCQAVHALVKKGLLATYPLPGQSEDDYSRYVRVA
jgi:hypothetical protein